MDPRPSALMAIAMYAVQVLLHVVPFGFISIEKLAMTPGTTTWTPFIVSTSLLFYEVFILMVYNHYFKIKGIFNLRSLAIISWLVCFYTSLAASIKHQEVFIKCLISSGPAVEIGSSQWMSCLNQPSVDPLIRAAQILLVSQWFWFSMLCGHLYSLRFSGPNYNPSKYAFFRFFQRPAAESNFKVSQEGSLST